MIKKTRLAPPLPLHPSYLRLLHQFPLRPIRNEREYDAAVKVMDSVVTGDDELLDPGERDYLEAITAFVEAYDSEHYEIDTSHVTPRRLIEFMMEQHDMAQSDLAKLLGSKAEASFLLSGKRNPSRTQCVLLGKRFGVEPGLFFAADAGGAANRRKAS